MDTFTQSCRVAFSSGADNATLREFARPLTRSLYFLGLLSAQDRPSEMTLFSNDSSFQCMSLANSGITLMDGTDVLRDDPVVNSDNLEDIMRNYTTTFGRIATGAVMSIAMLAVAASPSHAQKGKRASADSTYSIREKCVAKAQAAYPDNGLGTTTVMTQRTGIYADCARSNGIRP